MLDKVFSGFVSRAGGGWSGELIIAMSEDLKSTSTFEVCATRFKYQEASAGTLSVRFPCCSPLHFVKAQGNFEQDGEDEVDEHER